jgi:hypothetical protein
MNITIASNTIDAVIIDSIEAIDRSLGKIIIPPIIAPIPKDANSSPNPVEPSPSWCFAKSGRRDNNALLHSVNKPARIIRTCAA